MRDKAKAGESGRPRVSGILGGEVAPGWDQVRAALCAAIALGPDGEVEDTEKVSVLVAALDRAYEHGRNSRGPVIRCGCHPGVTWTVETWGQECPISKAERERDTLRAALIELSTLGNGDLPGNSIGNRIAQRALAELAPPAPAESSPSGSPPSDGSNAFDKGSSRDAEAGAP